MKLTEDQMDVLASLANAYEEDPSPQSGRCYFFSEEEYAPASELVELGLAFEVTWGMHANERWTHFGITDLGLEKL